MAVRSLRSMVGMAVRQAGTFSSSSPGIYSPKNALISHGVHGSPPNLDHTALSGFARSRGIHSRASQTAHTVRSRAADGAFAAMTVATSSAFAGIWYWMKHPDKPSVILMGGEDPAMKTEGYLRREQAAAAWKRAMDSYDEPVVEEDMDDDDPAMRARFEEWIKEYERKYKDEDEKARRFRIFKAFARSVDVNNQEAAKSGSNVQFGLTNFADWNSREKRSLCCSIVKPREGCEALL